MNIEKNLILSRLYKEVIQTIKRCEWVTEENYRKAFDNFEAEKIVKYTE